MKTLGQRIRELREEQDLSLRELAKKVKKSAPFLSDIELGRRYPSDDVLSKIANILGTTMEDLQEYDTRPPVEDIKRLSISDPLYGIAFRKVVEEKITSKELIEFLDRRSKNRKKS